MSSSRKTSQARGGLLVMLKRSPIGTPYRHRLVLRGLRLRKIRQIAQHPDTPQVRGMIHKIGYLLEVKSL